MNFSINLKDSVNELFYQLVLSKLLSCLRVFTDEDPEERRGQVLILLVEQALRFHDYKAANVHCQELMATGEADKLLSTLLMSSLHDE